MAPHNYTTNAVSYHSSILALTNMVYLCTPLSWCSCALEDMDVEEVTIRQQASPGGSSTRRGKGGSVKFSPESPRRRDQHQATSPTTGQTRPQSNPRFQHATPTSKAGAAARETNSSGGSSVDDSASPGSSMGGAPNLFPLAGFLRILLDQEKMLWGRNELLLNSLKSKQGASLRG